MGHHAPAPKHFTQLALVAATSLRVEIEFNHKLNDQRGKESVLLVRDLDLRVVALHRDRNGATEFTDILGLTHAVEAIDRDVKMNLVVKLGIGDLHVPLVVGAITNLIDIKLDRNFLRIHVCIPPVKVQYHVDALDVEYTKMYLMF